MGSAVDSTCLPADIESLGGEDVPINPTANARSLQKPAQQFVFECPHHRRNATAVNVIITRFDESEGFVTVRSSVMLSLIVTLGFPCSRERQDLYV